MQAPDPPWQPPPPYAPNRLYDALPHVPPLVVHLAACRLRGPLLLTGEDAALCLAPREPSVPSTPARGVPRSGGGTQPEGSALEAQSAMPARPMLTQEGAWPSAEAINDYLFAPDVAPPADRIPRLRQAAERLTLAVQRREPLGIHGDYDVDGITSTALLATWLEQLGVPVQTVLPRRDVAGYGLGSTALEQLAAAGCRLVIAVDCGVTDLAAARRARELGLELIILDHHLPGKELPDGALIINPRLPDGHPDDTCLSAVGLAYRLAGAMAGAGAGSQAQLRDVLDLVALGTIADVCALTGQNRRLVTAGLAALRQTGRPGIVALARCAGVALERLGSEDVAFRLAPRLNAAGRLADPRLAYQLLTTSDAGCAEQLAQQLNDLNRRRQRLTDTALTEAVAVLGPVDGAPRLLFAPSATWHLGVIGLVAGKLKERYQRPAVVLTAVEGGYSGSARSIDSFDIAAALHSCADLLLKSGGHARAAGLTVNNESLAVLQERLLRLADDQISPHLVAAVLAPEALVQVSRITPEVVQALELLGPFGESNRPPLLQADRLLVRELRPVGVGGAHAQLRLRSGACERRAIKFGADPDTLPTTGDLVDALFTPHLDVYHGQVRVELRLAALRPGDPSAQPSGGGAPSPYAEARPPR